MTAALSDTTKLDAMLSILAQAETPAERREAQDLVQALLGNSQDAPVAYRRTGTLLRYLRDEQTGDFAGEDTDSNPGQTLAQFYAGLFNDLSQAGSPPDDATVEIASEELDPMGWTIDRDESGIWFAAPVEQVEEAKGPLRLMRTQVAWQYAAERSPKGGITIAGTFYPGGRFIPGKVMEVASSEDRQRLDEARNRVEQEKAAQQAAPRKAKAQAVAATTLPQQVEQSDPQVAKSATRSLNALKRHHGAKTLDRIGVLTEEVEKAIAKAKPEKKAGLQKRLAELAVMARILSSGTQPQSTGPSHELETASQASPATGLSQQQPMATQPGAASATAVPEAGPGVGTVGGSASLPDRPDGVGDGVGGKAGGPGDTAGSRTGAGDGGSLSGAAGGTGSPATVGGGGFTREDHAKRRADFEHALAQKPSEKNPTDLAAGNWRYADGTLDFGGTKQKYRDNIDAIKTLRGIKLEGRTAATPAEQAILSKYTGWGQFKAIFNRYDYNWRKEAEELRSLLGDDAFEQARRSTLNAHYTHPDIVNLHWQLAQKLGFDGGRFLETSAGIGYYLGMMPADLASKTHTSAVELDSTTGEMLKMLYPAANVKVQGFQHFESPNNWYDLVASNVPFGDYKVNDPEYNKYKANIHDYFFLKSLDKAKPGGLVMHITSKGTLDKQDDKIRKELAAGAELVAAVRFPASAHKENAGTEVVTDLIILRKKRPGEQPVDPVETPAEAQPKEPGFTGITVDSLGRLYHWRDGKRVPGPNWLETAELPDPAGGMPIRVNKYFAENPEMILGMLDRSGSMYSDEEVSVSKTDDYEDRLQAAIRRIPEGILKRQDVATQTKRFEPATVAPEPGETKNGGYAVKDGKLYTRESGMMVSQEADAKTIKRIEAHLQVRDAVRAVINAQLNGIDATQARAELNAVYDAFVKKFGYLHENANRRAFRTDPDSPVLLALEKYDTNTKKASKADIFVKDTISYVKPISKTDDINEAVGVSLHRFGRVNVDHIAGMLGKGKEDVGRALVAAGIAFEDPSEGWQSTEEYLSGNVRRKLAIARAAAEMDAKFAANVQALENVQPEDIAPEDIEVRLGATWVPPSDIVGFAAFLLESKNDAFDIKYEPKTGQWLAEYANNWDGKRVAQGQLATKVFGTPDKDFMDVLEAALNNQRLQVWYTEPDGTRVIDHKATDDANGKIEEIKDKFKEWLWSDDERRERLSRYYNDNFNNIRNVRRDGSHLTFPGMNPAIQLRDHQKDFAWQVITTGKGLAAHEVGTGKTYTMIAAAMELRRLGLAKKPAIACLKANIEAITQDAIKLYPGARILSTADMFDADKRKQTISRIATGDYDLVIMTHDHLDLLQMKPEVVQQYIQEEIDELEEALEASREASGKTNTRAATALTKAKERLQARLEEAIKAGEKDDAVFFEETGIDQLFVDEAHKFKSLPCYTKQQGLKGVPTSRSDRATNMLMRTRWLQEQNGGRGVVFATGTPVANTMAELYNMQRYLQPNEMKQRGIYNFDAWASTFGDVQNKMEFTVSGEFKNVSRFARFVNIPELMQLSRQVMDVQRADGMTNPDGSPVIKRPKRRDQVIAAPKSEAMTRLMETLQQRARNLKGSRGSGSKDNMLAICTDGRKGSLDMRLLDANAEDDPNSKTNQAIRKVLDLHRKDPGKTQLIFSDVGVNPMENGFHLYGDVIDKLVAGGIPREKIADFSKLEGAKKDAAMEAMRRGDILIGIGSTEKLGTGVNVQNKLAALHHLDVPWLPASVEQRDGRGWRQGNENPNIDIYRYVSEGSLDQAFWQIIGNKTAFIKQVITNDTNPGVREARDDDSEELSPEQLMAAASGDPRILEKVNLDDEVKKLKQAQQRHEREQYSFRATVANTERMIPSLQKQLDAIRGDVQALADNPAFTLTFGGRTYTERPEAEKVVQDWVKANPDKITSSWPFNLGSYRGMKLLAGKNGLILQGPSGEEYTATESLRSVETIARNLTKRAADAEANLQSAQKDIERVRQQIGKPFAKAKELEEKSTRAKDLENQLAEESRNKGMDSIPVITKMGKVIQVPKPEMDEVYAEFHGGNRAAASELLRGLGKRHEIDQVDLEKIAESMMERSKKEKQAEVSTPVSQTQVSATNPTTASTGTSQGWQSSVRHPIPAVNIEQVYDDVKNNNIGAAKTKLLQLGESYKVPISDLRTISNELLSRFRQEQQQHARPSALSRRYARLAHEARRRGDLHSARIYARQARGAQHYTESLRYAWENRGQVGTNKSGDPVYNWVDPATGQSRQQHIQPGSGGSAKPAQPAPAQPAAQKPQTPAKPASAQKPAAAPKPAEPKPYGPSKAKVKYPSGKARKQATALVQQLFGENFKPEQVASLVGAPDDSTVTLDPSTDGKYLFAHIHHPSFAQPCVRYMGRDADGKVYMHNEIIDIKGDTFRFNLGSRTVEGKPDRVAGELSQLVDISFEDAMKELGKLSRATGGKGSGTIAGVRIRQTQVSEQGNGLGGQIFGRQVEQAKAAGVVYIECHAARKAADGTDYFNGYITWPKMGYNQSLESLEKKHPDLIEKIRERFPDAKDILDVVNAEGGEKFWQQHGVDLFHAEFDLSDDSKSMKRFEARRKKLAAMPPREKPRVSRRSGFWGWIASLWS